MTTFLSALRHAIGVTVRAVIYAVLYLAVGLNVVGVHHAAEPLWLYAGHVLTWPAVPLDEVVGISWLLLKYSIAVMIAGLAVLLMIATLATFADKGKK